MFWGAVPKGVAAPREVDFPDKAFFRLGDDVSWAEEGGDEAEWSQIPTGDSWNRHGVTGVGGRGWYRWEVSLPEVLAGEVLALSMGFVGSISEIYLNGRKIGGEGSMTSGAFPPMRTVHMAVIPPGLARFGGEALNTVALRVRGVGGLSGMLGGPVGIHPVAEAMRLKSGKERTREVVRISLAVMCLMWVGVMVLLWRTGLKIQALGWASWLALLMGGYTLLQSHYVHGGLLDDGWRVLCSWGVLVVFPPSLYLYTRVRCSEGSWWTWDVLVSLSTLSFVGVTGQFYREGDVWPIAAGYAGHFFLCAVAAMLTAFRTLRTGRRDALVSLISTGVVACFGTMDLVNVMVPWQPVAAMLISGSEAGLALFVMIQGATVIRQFARSQRRETALRHRLLRAYEDERRRIGHDLHDGLAQTLQGLLVRLHLEEGQVGRTEMKVGIKEAVREVREIARDLQPVHLRDATLEQAIQAMVVEAERELGTKVDFQCDKEAADILAQLPKRPVEILYRILQEALNNALQHAQANRIEIRVRHEGEAVVFTVEDDGCGFDVNASRAKQRLGLGFMLDRADLVGGTLKVKSGQGATRVRLWLPVEAGRELDSRMISKRQ